MSNLIRKPNGRGSVLNNVFNVVSRDEKLLRLLHYSYMDKRTGQPQDCLDPALPNIVGSQEHYKIVNSKIIKTIKEEDIKSEKECIIFIHLGKRRPVWGNHKLTRQELLIDVLVHNDFQEEDYRLDDICDRLDELIIGNKEIVMGGMDISTPIPYEAPTGYYRFQMKYIYTSNKK